ncbi:hypothetical protein NQZ68_001828 [Dissostichus eleginoides]|nr:hypothetical protein NQZ68_001828 [Dissostichus eleginoides]
MFRCDCHERTCSPGTNQRTQIGAEDCVEGTMSSVLMDTQMLAAAQSPPSRRPLLLGSPAHRHLALLRTADWRQSAATPLSHARKQGAH